MTTGLVLLASGAGDICRSALWDRINGWEVVIAVFIIITGWTGSRVAQMHYMAKVTHCPHHHHGECEGG